MAKKKKKVVQKRRQAKRMRARAKHKQRSRPTVTIFPLQSRPPVAKDGFRYVGPAQAMMDYAQPLIEELGGEDENSLNAVIALAQLCWTLALISDPDERAAKKAEMARKFRFPGLDQLIDRMIERHHQMFPALKEERGFYMRERILQPAKELHLFDESQLLVTTESIGCDGSESMLMENLKKLEFEIASGAEWDEYEKKLHKLQEQLLQKFANWCVAKGIAAETTDHFAFAVNRYLDFVFGYVGGTLAGVGQHTITEFMTDFWIRKTSAKAFDLSHMPKGLELFYQFLEEKGYLSDAVRVQKIIQRTKPRFLKNLRAFFGCEKS